MPDEVPLSESGDESPLSKVQKRKRKAWAPEDDDHAIYRWIKLECKSQHFVAEMFGISQSTVSRIVERYEKWQAHAEARDSGQLDPAERVRAQRALTYLRNEKIITSCLRLAGEVEGFQEVSNSTSAAPDGGLAGMREIRIMNRMLDRTGMASRFYRMAHRVGLDQLALVEKEPAIMPAPLSADEEAEHAAQAAADRAELQAARDKSTQEVKAWEASQGDRIQFAEQEAVRARQEADKLRSEMEAMQAALARTQRELEAALDAAEGQLGRGGEEEMERQRDGETEGMKELAIRESGDPAVVELKLHNLHDENGAKNGASGERACVCDAKEPREKSRGICRKQAAGGAVDEPRGRRKRFAATPGD